MIFPARVAQHAPLLLVYLDRELRVQFANLRCDELLGHPLEEIRGRLLAELVDAPTLRYALAHAAEIERGNPAPREYILRDKQGARRAVQIHASADLDAEGRAVGYFACAQSAGANLGELVGDAVCGLNPFAVERGVRIEVRAQGAEARVAGDVPRLRRAVARMIATAIERSASGSLVRVHMGTLGDLANVAIYDQCPQDLPRGHLGLSISRAFVEGLGGEVSVACSDAGAAIRVELPCLGVAVEQKAA
jgi:PAS domain S-box-containing protein